MLEQVKSAAPDVKALTEWIRILEAADEFDLFSKASEFAAQVELMNSAVAGLPESEDPPHLLVHIPAVKKLVSEIFIAQGARMGQYSMQVTDAMIYSLQTCARALRRNGHLESTIERDEIQRLIDAARQIVDDVSNSSLSEDVKVLIASRIREVEAALLGVRISGTANIQSALDALLGSGIRVAHDVPEEGRRKISEWISGLFSKFRSAASGTAAIATSAQEVTEAFRAITGG